jgi:peptidoglycan hydrolase-like protein with peptidoglycan-binding domain
MEATMRKLIQKSILGTASILALSIGGAALGYAAEPGNTAVADASAPAVSLISVSWRGDDFIRRDDVRWAQVELRYRGLYKGSLDGVLGPETKRALARFQTNNGMGQTASLDAQTWEALTGTPGIGQGSSTPPDSDRAGTMTNSSTASHWGK